MLIPVVASISPFTFLSVASFLLKISRMSISLSFLKVPLAVEPKISVIRGLILSLSKNSFIALFLSDGSPFSFL